MTSENLADAGGYRLFIPAPPRPRLGGVGQGVAQMGSPLRMPASTRRTTRTAGVECAAASCPPVPRAHRPFRQAK
jgi:hypothetical protein